MRVTEIFHSIQGESTLAGEPTVFVRFTGCDLRCQYCDTEYAFYGGAQMSPQQILDEVAKYPARFVCLTGGEPMLQKELPRSRRSCSTAATRSRWRRTGSGRSTPFPRACANIVDLKTPGSDEPHTDFAAFQALSPGDEVKVVVCSREDFRWALAKLDELRLWGKVPVLFSPSYGQVAAQDLAAWVLESGRPARLQLQLHKILWGEKRGV